MPIAETLKTSPLIELWHIGVKGQSVPYASRFLAILVIQCIVLPFRGSLFHVLQDHFTCAEKTSQVGWGETRPSQGHKGTFNKKLVSTCFDLKPHLLCCFWHEGNVVSPPQHPHDPLVPGRACTGPREHDFKTLNIHQAWPKKPSGFKGPWNVSKP